MFQDTSSAPSTPSEEVKPDQSLKMLTTVIYALQAAGFLLGITYIIAVIINYVKKDEVRNTLYASHFRWQIRTFWFSVLWNIIGFVTLLAMVGYFVLFANTIWVIYRIVKGWMNLSDQKPMY